MNFKRYRNIFCFIFFLLSAAQANVAVAQLQPHRPTLPWLLTDVVLKDAGESFKISGNRLKVKEIEMPYPKLVPLKESQELNVEIRYLKMQVAESEYFESHKFLASFPDGTRYADQDLVDFVNRNKFVYVCHSFEKLERIFLNSLREDVPIIRLSNVDPVQFQLKFPFRLFERAEKDTTNNKSGSNSIIEVGK